MTKEAYNALSLPIESLSFWWWHKALWKWHLPLKVKCFNWLMLEKKIMT